MPARQLSRERGVIITCSYGDYVDEPGDCDAKHYTANVVVKTNRKAAVSTGWIRGGGLVVDAGTTARSMRPSNSRARPRSCA